MKDSFVPIRDEPYRFCIGKTVEIESSVAQKFGFYRGKNNSGDLILQPCIIFEGKPTDPNKPNGERTARWLWSKEPIYIAHSYVVAVSPLRKEYLDKRVEETSLDQDRIIVG
jgi:hypothetical protein